MTDRMLPYNVTAIVCGLLCIDDDVVKAEIDAGATPLTVMDKYGNEMLKRLSTFFKMTPTHCQSLIMWLSFEAVCKSRTCLWGNNHPELAISYDRASYRFLGCMFNVGYDTGVYRTHCQLQKFVKKAKLPDPYFWKIKHTSQVDAMTKSLDMILKGEITKDEFFAKFPPINMADDNDLDFEGGVLFTIIPGSEPLGIGTADDDQDVDYGKVKTVSYYAGHKFMEKKLPQLLAMPRETGRIVPLVGAVHEFYTDLEKKMLLAQDAMVQVLDLVAKGEHDVNKAITDEKILMAFEKANNTIAKTRIAIFNSPLWKQVCFDIYKESFPSLVDDSDTHTTLKALISTIKPWEAGFTERVGKIIEEKHDNIKALFSCILRGQDVILT